MLEARNLGFAGPDPSRPRLRGLDFSIAPGESLVLVGPEDAGKSLLLRILAGAVRDYAGTVTFQGRELKAWSRDFFEKTGAMLDPPGFFPQLTVLENLKSFAGLYQAAGGGNGPAERARARLERCGAADLAKTRADRLSAGQLVLAGMARALLHEPALLFLDLPASPLDPATAGKVAEVIRSRKQAGGSTVLATRDADWGTATCDRVLWLAIPGGEP
jgi:fluoroquinolone transport system ATP-binding protein